MAASAVVLALAGACCAGEPSPSASSAPPGTTPGSVVPASAHVESADQVPRPAAKDGTSGELAVIDAQGGRLVAVDAATGRYRLELDGVRPNAVWFDDRPGRQAGQQPVATVVEGFFAPDANGPPNAALDVEGEAGAPDVVILELSAPVLSGDQLTFEAHVLPEPPAGAIGSFRDQVATTVPATFGPASLFLDAVLSHMTTEGYVFNYTAVDWNLSAHNNCGSCDPQDGTSWPPTGLAASSFTGSPSPMGELAFTAQGGGSVWNLQGDLDVDAWMGVTFDAADGSGQVVIAMTSPEFGSNQWSCSVSYGPYTCNMNGGSNGGSDLSVEFDICGGADVPYTNGGQTFSGSSGGTSWTITVPSSAPSTCMFWNQGRQQLGYPFQGGQQWNCYLDTSCPP